MDGVLLLANSIVSWMVTSNAEISQEAVRFELETQDSSLF
jgi:hypothetical protein